MHGRIDIGVCVARQPRKHGLGYSELEKRARVWKYVGMRKWIETFNKCVHDKRYVRTYSVLIRFESLFNVENCIRFSFRL